MSDSSQSRNFFASSLFLEDLVVDGILTPLGIEKIKASMPEVDPARITEGFRADDIPTLFTVQTFVNITKNLLEEKEKTG